MTARAQRLVGLLLVAGLLVLGTVALSHAVVHGDGRDADCVSCTAVHAAAAMVVAVAPLLLGLAPAGRPLGAPVRWASRIDLGPPAPRGPPLSA
jgi:hypothetical protein